MSWTLISSEQELEQVLERASRCEAVALDTEFMRRRTFYPQVALLQLCFDEEAWLIDPLALDDCTALIDFFENPNVVKVLHSASEDLEVFDHWLGVLPRPLFDTQRAAALINRGFGMGYRALVESICGVDLPKGETQSDWLQRPLTSSQCEYAAQDVTYLLKVWHVLAVECRQADKFDWVLADAESAMLAVESSAEPYYPKIKSAWKLSPQQLAILASVSAWREREARSSDKPRSWIIDDKTCLDLAQRAPSDHAALAAELDLPPPALRRYGEVLLELVADSTGVEESELPPRLPPPLQAQQRNRLKKLKSKSQEIARALDIAPEAALQAKDYEILLRAAEGEDCAEPHSWQGWRKERVVQPLYEFLRAGGASQ